MPFVAKVVPADVLDECAGADRWFRRSPLTEVLMAPCQTACAAVVAGLIPSTGSPCRERRSVVRSVFWSRPALFLLSGGCGNKAIIAICRKHLARALTAESRTRVSTDRPDGDHHWFWQWQVLNGAEDGRAAVIASSGSDLFSQRRAARFWSDYLYVRRCLRQADAGSGWRRELVPSTPNRINCPSVAMNEDRA